MPILAGLPLLFMANSPAPLRPLDDYYQDITTEVTNITGDNEEDPLTYKVQITNTGEKYATAFDAEYQVFHLDHKKNYSRNLTAERFEGSLFYNEIILPGETKTYNIQPQRILDPMPQNDEYVSYFINPDTYVEDGEGLSLTPIEEVDNQYLINGVKDEMTNSRSSVVVIEGTYDGENFVFYSLLNEEKMFTINTFSELDLTKLTITKSSYYKTVRRGGSGFSLAGLILVLLVYGGYYLAYGFLICAAIGVFIIAPAIVIPISIKKGKRRAEEREKAMKNPKENSEKAPEKKEEVPEETVEVTPEELTDINKVE